MKLLTCPIFKTERGSQGVSLERALDSLDQGIRKLNFAVENPRSPEGMALRYRGFVSIILVGPKGDEAIEYFHTGGCERIADNGRSVIFDAPCPEQNARAALEFLKVAYQYGLWVKGVEQAAVADKRPPVFDTMGLGGVSDSVRSWIGQNAEAYFSAWAAERLDKAAAHVQQSVVQSV